MSRQGSENVLDWFDQPGQKENLKMDDCFAAFDQNGDNLLDLQDFGTICSALFRSDKGVGYSLDEKQLGDIFSAFDKNKDGVIDRDDFVSCWEDWIKKILRPVSVFVIVDVQNDFITGSLKVSDCPARHNGAEVIEPINRLLETVNFDRVIFSLDWHPSSHVSFIDNLHLRRLDSTSRVSADEVKPLDTVIFEGPPKMTQKMWPRHCVQETWGAELHKDLIVPGSAIMVYKGENPEVDSYSAFWDNSKLSETTLNSHLQDINATDVYVCGLAYDVCVGATAEHGLELGYRTILVDDCSRGVDLNDIEITKNRISSHSGLIVDSSQVKGMVKGRDRRPELGYKLAMELKKRA